MKTRNTILGALAVLTTGALSFAADAPAPAPAPAAAPVAAPAAAPADPMAAVRAQFEAMNQPQEPFKIADNLYYVGMSDVTAFLITTKKDGYILLDGGFESSAPQIIKNIRRLGFDPKKVRILINSHGHIDHAGGLAALKQATGAVLFASEAEAPLLEAGGRGDFALGDSAPFPPVSVDIKVSDGEQVTLGPIVLTAHVTAGHTKGCTTWTMPVTIDDETKNALFLCSLSVLPMFKLIDNPAYPTQADDFLKSFDALNALPCDVFLASHGSFFAMKEKYAKLEADAKPNPFIDPEGCRAYFAKAREAFKQALLGQCKADPACAKREGLE